MAIKEVSKNEKVKYQLQFTGCIVLNHAGEILLQQRPESFVTFPGRISTFGGRVELGESELEAIKRELAEELGAAVDDNIIELGAITESYTDYNELIHCFYWQDCDNTITGCYEGNLIMCNSIEQALQLPKLMEDVEWMLKQCQKHGILK